MAQIKIRGLRGVAKEVQQLAKKLASEAVQDKKLGTRIKNIIINTMRKDGVLPSGRSIADVQRRWSRRRDRLAQFNKTIKAFNSVKGTERSRLTFTGQFLASFVTSILKTSKDVRYTIEPDEDAYHKGYKLPGGGRSKRVPMTKIAEGQIAQGRNYTDLSEKTVEKIEKAIRGRIRRELKLRLRR